MICDAKSVRLRKNQNWTTHVELRQVCERLDALERRQLVVVDLQRFVICDAKSVRLRKNQNWTTHVEHRQVCEQLDAVERRQLVVSDLQ